MVSSEGAPLLLQCTNLSRSLSLLYSRNALGTFLDIDNVSFDAIERERALDSKCKSAEVNQWIRSMIYNRQTTVELQGEQRTIAIRRGCLLGGILSPFLWNLVVNELL